MSQAIAKQWADHWSKRGPECPEKTVAKEYLSLTLERDDLAMLLRRMLWASAVENDGRGLGLIRLNAVDYLRRHGLSGRVTRDNMHKDPKDVAP